MIETIATSIVTSAAIVWIARTWISERLSQSIRFEYSQKLEVHKSQLKAESEVEIEKLRSELRIAAEKRSIEYSRIHEKRLEIISSLAGKIDAFHQSVAAYVSPIEWQDGPTKEERRKISGERLQEFSEYYRPNRLFLPKQTVKRLEDFKNGLYQISMDFMFYVEQKNVSRSEPAKDLKVWQKANEYISREVPKIIEALEDDFRKLLGMEGDTIEPVDSANGDSASAPSP